MSSFITHALVGGSAGYFTSPMKHRKMATVLGIIVGMLPDMDYRFSFLRTNGRITHTIGFALLMTVVLWGALKICKRPLPIHTIFAISICHFVLDFLVGVHINRFFWPFSDEFFRLPIGILPSSGWPQLTNFYFWRNLFIEMGIFLPILYSLSKKKHGWILSIPFLLWSISLAR